MPAELDRAVEKLMAKGFSKDAAYAIAVKATGWKRKKGGGWTKNK